MKQKIKLLQRISFFKGPAILLEKDGERYIQITVTGKQYIESLKNKFGEMVVVKEDVTILLFINLN